MGPSIGGVEVTNESGGVKWGLLGAILVGGPVYAYFQGLISMVQLFGGGLEATLSGVGGFVSDLFVGTFAGISFGIGQAWDSFLREATFAGPLTFVFVVGVTTGTLVILSWGVSRIRV